MKKLVFAIMSLAIVVLGYMTISEKVRIPLGVDSKKETVRKGDLTIPISATGEVHPARQVVIKSEASGEIIKIPKDEGSHINEGELIFRLDPIDEERSVARAVQDVNVAKSRVRMAEIDLEQARGSDLRAAQSRIDQIEAQIEASLFQYNKIIAIEDEYKREDEIVQRKSAWLAQKAQLETAKAEYERAQQNIPRMENALVQAEAALANAQTILDDARERLKETDIVAPIDGIISQLRTQIGEVISGGKTTFTGGTELARILDVNKMVVRAEVDESDIGRVLEIAPDWAKPGRSSEDNPPVNFDEAAMTIEHLPTIRVEAFHNEKFTGVIEKIYPEPTSLSNIVTYQVDVVVVGENKKLLLPGMRADVTFTSEHLENVVLVKNEAIRQDTSGKLGVYIPLGDSDAEEEATKFVECKIGLTNGTYSEIKSGLEEGDLVYTKLPRKKQE